MEKLQNSLACISAEEPSPHILQRTTLRRALHGKNASGAELSLSALTFRALAEGVTSARLRAALDDETDPREAVIEAIVQLNRRYGVSDAERAAGANGIWTARGPGEAAAPSPPVAFDVAALEEELKKLQLGGLWQRATNAGVAAKEVAAALDLPERQRLRKLSALVSTEEQARASAVAARSRTSAKRRSTAHELVWGDSEDEEDDLLEVGFPRVAVDGPPDDLHIGLPVRIRDVEVRCKQCPPQLDYQGSSDRFRVVRRRSRRSSGRGSGTRVKSWVSTGMTMSASSSAARLSGLTGGSWPSVSCGRTTTRIPQRSATTIPGSLPGRREGDDRLTIWSTQISCTLSLGMRSI